MIWKIADAKNRLSELFNRTYSEGPQTIQRRDEIVIVMTEQDYNRLTGSRPSFTEMLTEGPSFEGLSLDREKSLMRELPL